MNRRVESGWINHILGRALAIGLVGCSTGALAQTPAPSKTMPDAQVEANVLRALAGAHDLTNQQITTTTVYGVVTLSGSVATEAQRTEAENLASRTTGVQKVIDEMTLGTASAQASTPSGADDQAAQSNNGMVLQSDGTMVPANQAAPAGSENSQDSAQTQPPPDAANPSGQPNYGPGAPEYRQPYNRQQQSAYAQGPGYPPQPGYGPPPQYPRSQGYAPDPNNAQQAQYGGQQAGEMVMVPSGVMVRIRINQSLDSNRTQPGTKFDGVVVNDIVAGNAVAIPRGAAVQGTVVDVKKSGALKGRGELSLQLTSVTLAGQTYPIISDVWTRNGGNKTTETVNKTVIGGGLGALFGAAAGGGAGAAIGAGIGGALGLGSSAASGNGPMYIPAEGLLSFRLSQPVSVATVSQEEMNRLAQGVPMGTGQPPMRRRMAVYPAYGPLYYPAYPPYRTYPYPYPY